MIMKWIPTFLLRPFMQMKIPATKNGQLCDRFANGTESIRPIIFSHGHSSEKCLNTALYLAMAASGYLVIAINHQDETCFYTEDKDNKPMPFVDHDLYFSLAHRKKQVKVRASEIHLIIEALREFDDEIKIQLFGACGINAKIDMKELILSGHSMGGCTAIEAANQLRNNDQPRALLLMDPWFFPIHDDIQNGSVRFNCPVQMIWSETFHKEYSRDGIFDSAKHEKQIVSTASSQNLQHECLTINGTEHLVQTDFSIFWKYELQLALNKAPTNWQYSMTYQLHFTLML